MLRSDRLLATPNDNATRTRTGKSQPSIGWPTAMHCTSIRRKYKNTKVTTVTNSYALGVAPPLPVFFWSRLPKFALQLNRVNLTKPTAPLYRGQFQYYTIYKCSYFQSLHSRLLQRRRRRGLKKFYSSVNSARGRESIRILLCNLAP